MILVVDHEPEQAALTRTVLETGFFVRVDIANGCAAARDRLRSSAYDAVILACRLPDGSGLDLLREISHWRGTPPVIMVAGRGDEDAAAGALRLGASGCVIRDERMSALLVEAVEKALGGAPYRPGEKRPRHRPLLVQSAIDSIDDVFLVMDLDGRFISWNESARRVLGYSVEEMGSKKITDGLEGRVLERAVDGLRAALRGRGSSTFEIDLATGDGRLVPNEFRCALVNDADGNPVAVSCVGRDLSGRRMAEEELRRSEERYRAIVDDQDELICRLTADSLELTFMNEAMCRYFGIAADALLGSGFLHLLDRADAERIAGLLEGVRVGDDAISVEEKQPAPDGRSRWQSWSVRPVFDSGGTVVEIQAVGRDITERKEAEEALRRSEERFKALVERSNDIVAIVSPDGTIEFINPTVQRVLGLSPDEMTGRSAFEFAHPDDVAAVLDIHNRALEEPDMLYSREIRMRCADGSWKYVDTFGSALMEGPVLVGTLINARDTSERRLAEEALRMSAARAEILARVSEEYANAGLDYDRVLRVIAGSSAELIGDMALILLASDDRKYFDVAAIEHPDPEARRLAVDIAGSTRWPVADGVISRAFLACEQVYLEELGTEAMAEMFAEKTKPFRERFGVRQAVVSPMRVEGAAIGVLVLSRDNPGRPYTGEDRALLQEIADRAAMAIEMARLHRVAREELIVRREREQELQGANAELSGFAYTVSHDLRGPVSTMRANIEILKLHAAGMSEAETAATLESLAGNADRCYALIDDLLALATSAQAPAAVEEVDVSEVVRAVLENHRPEIDERHVTARLDEPLGVVRADRTHIYQVFSNLVLNAVRHSGGGSTDVGVHYLGREVDGAHRYVLRDNGAGIPEELLGKVFEPFVKGSGGGTGIGLAIVEKVIRRYGGTVEACNENGACFEFTIYDYPA